MANPIFLGFDENQAKIYGTDPNDSFEPLREQDRFLPIANVARIMKKYVPENGKIAKDAKECVQECISEFISFITSEASDKCQTEKRKTINGDDIIYALKTLGFDSYVEPLNSYLYRYRESIKTVVATQIVQHMNKLKYIDEGLKQQQIKKIYTPDSFSLLNHSSNENDTVLNDLNQILRTESINYTSNFDNIKHEDASHNLNNPSLINIDDFCKNLLNSDPSSNEISQDVHKNLEEFFSMSGQLIESSQADEMKPN